MTDSFPRQQARTQRFSLGAPRSFQISPDGSRIAFLRSKGGSDPVTCLWVLDVLAESGIGQGGTGQGGAERLVADPVVIAMSGPAAAAVDEPEEERARRERSREQAGGVVAFATDSAATMAAFALAGQVYITDLLPGGAGPRPAVARFPAIDPRPDPAGQRVAYVCDGALRLTDVRSGEDTELIGPNSTGSTGSTHNTDNSRSMHGAGSPGSVTFGLAEFVAAEEMGRMRGFWWAPDGSALLVARVDETPVQRWHIADPANPDRVPTQISYPSAGTPNALVSLLLVRLNGTSVPVRWDARTYSYLVTADWEADNPLIVVQSRDQRLMQLLAIDPVTGGTSVVRADSAEHWLDIVPGVPGRTAGGKLVWTADVNGAKRLLVATAAELTDGSAEPVTPPTLQVRGVASIDGDTVLFTGSDGEPTEIGVWTYGPGGLSRLAGGAGELPGVHGALRAGGTTVLASHSISQVGATVRILREPPGQDGRQTPAIVATIASLAEQPALPRLRIELLRAGRREIRTGLLLPSWHEAGSAKLPVLMDPYGGPHSQRVLASADIFLTSQWFAEQGFAVVIADGRGTPGRGPQWDRSLAGDLAGPVLDDQVDALVATARTCPDLDLSKVAIRGWSFGGFLAALAVLRRPDVFHAAVAGAPVTDWRLYDTHYTERYLGHPDTCGATYDRSSLLADAHKLTRPLLIIHGLADDNVVVAHSLRFSCALLSAGRPHSVLPLTGVTHMASQEEVAENLLLLQVDFLRRALGIGQPTSQPGA
jgi:dipeptidyl-peptidase-4